MPKRPVQAVVPAASERRATPTPTTIAIADEEVLVARIRAGDRSAFETLFRVYYPRLVAVMRGFVHSDAVAEERVQDILLRLWEHRTGWVVRDGLARYLYGAVRNQGVNWQKHERVKDRWTTRAVADVSLSGMGRGPSSPEEELAHREIDVALTREVARLPERRRLAFTLRSQYGLTNQEIADAMGVTVKAVEKSISAALKTLRDNLIGLL